MVTNANVKTVVDFDDFTVKQLKVLARAGSEHGAPLTLADMIAAVFPADRVNSSINEDNFPPGYHGLYDATGLYLFGGDAERSILEVEEAIRPGGGCLEGLCRGLAHLKSLKDKGTLESTLKAGPVVFPKSSWVDPDGHVHVPYAYLSDGGPFLYLDWGRPGDRWGRRYRFLVSRKSRA